MPNLIAMGGQAWGIFGGIGEYRRRRDQGSGRMASAVGAYVNARVFANPLVGAAMLAPPIVKSLFIDHPWRNQRAMRRMTSLFSVGQMPDNDLLAQSKAAQMQSAMMAHSALSLSGHSFAGMEASVYHARYR